MEAKIVCRMISSVVVDGKEIKIEVQACATEDDKRFLRVINEEDDVVEIDDADLIAPIYKLIKTLHVALTDIMIKSEGAH
jgi:hypothetical protein